MKNNNQAIVKKITGRTMSVDKKRNFFIIIAIALTTFLLGSVFSVGMSLLESIKINQIRLMGTIAHAAIGYPTVSQLEQLHNLDYIETVGTDNLVGYVKNMPQMRNTSLTLHYFDETDWEELRSPAYVDIEGNYPQNENEIMASRWLLKKLGIDNPFIGMEIHLTYYIDSKNSHKQINENFRLSGWFTSFVSIKSLNAADIMLVSQKLSQKHGKTIEKDGAANVVFDNPSKVLEYCNRLASDLGLSENQPIVSAEAPDTDGGQEVSSVIALSAIVIFLIFIGYLLIYNVLYISVSRDVSFYGLLKTLGTTPRQIKKIVIGQIMRLCMIGIPIGLVLALLLSFVFVPFFISRLGAVSTEAVVSFSPFIYLGSAVFAMLTAVLGAMKPAQKAASISPIEAQKYTGVEVKKNSVHLSAQGKLHKIAIRNIFRDKKQTGIVLLSLILGMTTFLSVTTLVLSMNVDSYIDSIYESDFSLKSYAGPKQIFDNAYINKLKALPGFENLIITTWEQMGLDYSSEIFNEYITDFCKKENIMDLTEEDIYKSFRGFIIGVNGDDLMKLNETLDNPIDINAFECGETALIATDNPNLFSNVRELSISPQHRSESSNEESNNNEKIVLSLGGFVPFNFRDTGSGLAPTIVISNTLMNKLYMDPIISNININVLDGYDEQALYALKQMVKDNDEVSLVSKIESMDELNGAKIILFVLGGGIALVIAFIGILNFINVMSVSVIVRRRELATLESIGMSRKQVRNMLIWEGIGYAMITLILFLSVGNVVTYGIFKLFQQQVSFATFMYPFIPVIIMIMVVLVVCFITPQILYHSISSATIVERLREAK